jgi:hypothetical protein
MQLASFGIWAFAEGRAVRSKTKEKKMQVWTLKELFCLTRTELFALHHEIAGRLVHLPEGSAERGIALTNLRNIRRVLTRLHPTPS